MNIFDAQGSDKGNFAYGGGIRGGNLLGIPSSNPPSQFGARNYGNYPYNVVTTPIRKKAFSTSEQLDFSEIVKQCIIGASSTLSPKLNRKIIELFSLKAGWDGESAEPIKPFVFVRILEVLLRLNQRPDFVEPFLAPTFDGFIQMEWHDKIRSLEIEALNNSWSIVGTSISNNQKRTLNVAESDSRNVEHLVAYYEWFLGSELLWLLQ